MSSINRSEESGETTLKRQNQQVDEVDEKLLREIDLYGAKNNAEATKFHLYEDCQYLSDTTPKLTTLNTIRYHDLGLCTSCRRRFFALIPTRKSGKAPRNNRKVWLKPTEREMVDAFISTGVLKDRATTVRAGLCEIHQLVEEGKTPEPYVTDSENTSDSSSAFDTSNRELIYADIFTEDVELVNRLTETDQFATANEVYRTAVILYLNTLSELGLEPYLRDGSEKDRGTDVETVISFEGFETRHGGKPTGSVSRLKKIAQEMEAGGSR